MLFYGYDNLQCNDEHESAKKLLFDLLKKHLPEICKDATLEHNDLGAPYLAQSGKKTDGIFVSLSHSHGICAAALSDRPVGIDIEKVRDIRKRESAIERRFLSNFDIADASYTDLESFFYKWTCAEACFKASGKWSSEGLDYFHKEATVNGERYILCVAQAIKG